MSISKRITLTVKHFHLVLKIAGDSPGSSLKNSCDLLSTLGKVSGIMLQLIHGSKAPDKINIAIQPFLNDV